MNKGFILIICLFGLLLLSPVFAEQITMTVDSKRIEGIGTGATPLDDDFCNPMYIVCEREHYSTARYVLQEYPVSFEDYYKIQLEQKIILEKPDYSNRPCKVVSIQ